jgi:hypothetical protein
MSTEHGGHGGRVSQQRHMTGPLDEAEGAVGDEAGDDLGQATLGLARAVAAEDERPYLKVAAVVRACWIGQHRVAAFDDDRRPGQKHRPRRVRKARPGPSAVVAARALPPRGFGTVSHRYCEERFDETHRLGVALSGPLL